MKKILSPFIFLTFFIFNSFADEYSEKIQPLFNQRCIACHSCLNAPCQVNLQSYEGFERGGHHLNIYDGLRTESVPPTRLWFDASTTKDWRKKGFFTLNTDSDPIKNLFFMAMATDPTSSRTFPTVAPADSRYCEDKISVPRFPILNNDKLKMPYALPSLEKSEIDLLREWIRKGAPGPTTKNLERKPLKEIEGWENFFNGKTNKEKLIARYLYEHLFLAHFYFSDTPNKFFELVRSTTKCDSNINVIATRRPNDDPNFKNFYYCLRPFMGTVVAKTHLPFELNEKKLQRIKNNFLSGKWQPKVMPSYLPQTAANPFLAFEDIPVGIRYQFLLDHAEYIISTFIKGPVCNGSNAVNAIQEQFYVFFIDPQFDLMAKEKEFENELKKLSTLPGLWGSDIKISDGIKFNNQIIKNRDELMKIKARWMEKTYPNGLPLEHIWDGDNENPNALLTVFRHDDNAFVTKGAKGDIPKTIFVLNYPILEQLVYNLVVNFDVYGNITHQTLTRLYMDLLRMDAEDLFLAFLPRENRSKIKKDWYRGLITETRMKYFNTDITPNIPNAINFEKTNQVKKEFVERILFKYFNKNVRGKLDLLNWKKLSVGGKKDESLNKVESFLSEITSQSEQDGFLFAQYFPDVVLLQIKNEDKSFDVYTVIHNKEHENISWIMAEPLRFSPEEDTLTIEKGFYGLYPNLFLVVEKNQVDEFVSEIKKINSNKTYRDFMDKYAIKRKNESFWTIYDQLNANFKETTPREFGYLDLTRYRMDESWSIYP